MIYVFLAEGFEEIEALATVDILRRSELDVATVGVGSKVVTGSHGIPVVCDVIDCEILPDQTASAVILPGGMPGTLNLEKYEKVQMFIDYAAKNNILIAAICAAPSILGHKGLLNKIEATCYTGFEEQLSGAKISKKNVCVCGNIITANGAGSAFDFSFAIADYFSCNTKKLKAAMKCAQ